MAFDNTIHSIKFIVIGTQSVENIRIHFVIFFSTGGELAGDVGTDVDDPPTDLSQLLCLI